MELWDVLLPLAVAGAVGNAPYYLMRSSGAWASTRVRALFGGLAATVLSAAIVNTALSDLYNWAASEPVAPAKLRLSFPAVLIIVAVSALVGFRRSAFFQFMPLDEAVKIVDAHAESLRLGQSGYNHSILRRAIHSLGRLPLDAEYRKVLEEAPSLAMVQQHFSAIRQRVDRNLGRQ